MNNLELKTEQWLSSNPQAFILFEKFALKICKTNQKFGAKLIAERVRWESYLQKTEKFKWCNNHTAYVSRKFADKYPEYKHLLTFRNINEVLKNETESSTYCN